MSFKENAGHFHWELGKKLIDVKDPPIIEETEKFWGNIRETNKENDKEATWIQRQEDAKKGPQGPEVVRYHSPWNFVSHKENQ